MANDIITRRRPVRREQKQVIVPNGDEPWQERKELPSAAPIAQSIVSNVHAYKNGNPSPKDGKLSNKKVKRLARGQMSVSRRAPSVNKRKKAQSFDVSKHLWVFAIVGDVGMAKGDNNPYDVINDAKNLDELYNNAMNYLAEYIRLKGWAMALPELKRAKKADELRIMAQFIADNIK
jgi:hypothetical protein